MTRDKDAHYRNMIASGAIVPPANNKIRINWPLSLFAFVFTVALFLFVTAPLWFMHS